METTPHLSPEGAAVRVFRDRYGVPLTEIAKQACVSHSALYRLINGEGQVYLATWRRIEAALDPSLYGDRRPATAPHLEVQDG